ncbi:VOC family protein [Phenylobacterium sp.]|uniref:VOC family protein n=1 Tax=Phenylobacterium sp. TaxID=1871053 RepID=UPI0035650EED
MAERPAIVASLFYKDPIAAMKWLEQAFGFETTILLTDAEGRLGHAEMEFRGCPVSIGGEFGGALLGGAQMKSPENLGGNSNQFLRVELADGIDAHCERARAAGARITAEPQDQFYGSRTYRALDIEGHVWNFSQAVRVVSGEEMEKASGLKIHTSLEGV